MIDYSVRGLTVSDVATMNNALQPVMVRQVLFYIGLRGPFIVQFKPADYTPEAVVLAVQNEAMLLRQIDAGLEQV